MTEKLYWKDSYMTKFEATVIDHNEKGILLDKTAFYPTGGGQLNDIGEITYADKKINILDVKKEKDSENIFHIPQQGAVIEKGTKITGSIDWERRYSLMKYHTFFHVLDAIIYKEYSGKITGGIIYPDRSHIDFDLPSLNRETAEKIIQRTNLENKKAYEVKSYFITREEAEKMPDLVRTMPGLSILKSLENIRIVEICGLDAQIDGGTHVRNTNEIGDMVLSGFKNLGSHRKRIEVKLIPKL